MADRQCWQYARQVIPDNRLEEELSEMGLSGWELIHVQWEEYHYGGQTQQQARCIFKRPRPCEDEYGDDFGGETYGRRRSVGVLG